MMKMVVVMMVVVSALVGSPAMARDVTGLVEVNSRSILRADDWVWQDTQSREALVVEVNLQTQMAYVRRGDTLVGVSTVSSGKTGYETPEGDYTVLWKEELHLSKAYNNAPMPFTMWINTEGYALHAGKIPGYAASHGCVRLPIAFAEKLFSVVDKTTQVYIRNTESQDRMSLNDFLASR